MQFFTRSGCPERVNFLNFQLIYAAKAVCEEKGYKNVIDFL